MRFALVLTTLFVFALIGVAAYMLSTVTGTGSIALWTIILAVNVANCWCLGKVYADFFG
jgi:hypothetical protein